MSLEQIREALAGLDREETISLTVQAILAKTPHREILLRGLLTRDQGLINEFPVRGYGRQGLGPELHETLIPFHGAHVPLPYVNELPCLFR